MSEGNLELARRFHEAFNRDGWDALWAAADPDIEFHEPPEQPGASVYRGIEAVREGVARSWGENWLEQHADPERFVDLGNDRVLLLTVQHLRGRDGIELTQPAGNIVTFRSGKIARIEAFWNQQTAIEAAGLAE
jgi:ketosteroid isomerase-like protein